MQAPGKAVYAAGATASLSPEALIELQRKTVAEHIPNQGLARGVPHLHAARPGCLLRRRALPDALSKDEGGRGFLRGLHTGIPGLSNHCAYGARCSRRVDPGGSDNGNTQGGVLRNTGHWPASIDCLDGLFLVRQDHWTSQRRTDLFRQQQRSWPSSKTRCLPTTSSTSAESSRTRRLQQAACESHFWPER